MTAPGERLYLDYHGKVSAYIRGKVKNHHDAEDLTSQVFEKVFGKLHTFDETRASVSTWIYTIARNTVTDYFRSRRTTVEFADWMDYAEQPEDASDGALENLADGLLSLKEKERDLILLHYYNGYTLKAVAEKMGMSYITAKVLHKKALSGLREALADAK